MAIQIGSAPVQFAQMHAAFCRAGLPVRTQRTAWTRATPKATVTFDPATADIPVPSGPILRLLLLHICTVAAVTREPTVDLGASAEELAEKLGIPGKAAALAEQIERLVATRVTIGEPGRTAISLLDTRGRSRKQRAGWLSALKLTTRFVEGLQANIVSLDADLTCRLAETPAAFDAYIAVRADIAPFEAKGLTSAPWEDVMRASGIGTGGLRSFLRTLEANLAILRDAGIHLPLSMDDEFIHLTATTVSAPVEEAQAPLDEEHEEAPSPAPEAEPQEQVAAPVVSAVSEAVGPEQAVTEQNVAPLPSPAEPEPASQDRPVAIPDEPPEPAIPQIISLPRQLTGLPWVVWLRRGYGPDGPLVGLTPTERFDARQMALLMVEPVIMVLEGSIEAEGVDQVSEWITANRDLIDDVWNGSVASLKEVRRRHKRTRSGSSMGW